MTVKQSAAQIHTFYIIKDFGTFCNAESSDFLSLWNKSYFCTNVRFVFVHFVPFPEIHNERMFIIMTVSLFLDRVLNIRAWA